MASLSNINGLFDVHSTGAILFSTSHGTSGQILKSNGNAAPTWVDASTVIGGPYLPLSGGTLTGATATASGISFTVGGVLNGTSATFTGKVGIGTTTPEEKMVVMGNIGFGGGGYNGGVFANNNDSVTGVDSNWGLEVQRTANTDDYNTRLKYYPTNGSLRKAGIWNSRDGYFTIYSDDDTVPSVIIPTGKVGIGTTSPSTKLHISAASSNSQLTLERTGSATGKYGIYTNTNNLYINNVASSSFPLVILNNGNVGIGTTSPLAKLHINGTGDAIRVESTNTGAGGAQIDLLHYTTSPASGDLHGVINFGGYYSGTNSAYGSRIASVWTNAANRLGRLEFITRNGSDFNTAMTINHASNVGIGTTSPDSKLNINGASAHLNFTGSNNRINFSGYRAIEGSHTGSLLQIGESYTNISLYGNVGIGTTSPGAKLEVNAQGGGVGGYTGIKMKYGTSSVQSLYMGQVTAGNGAFIGTAQYRNAGYWQSESTASSVINMDAAGNMSFYTNSGLTANTDFNISERMRIDTSGNVGIGTTTPTALLDLGNSINDNKIHLYVSGNDKYGMGIRGSQFLFYSGGLGAGSGGITFGKMNGTTYTESMRVTNDGNVGIGTTSPSGPFHVKVGTSTPLIVASSSYCNNVGIRTTTPTASLQVKGNVSYSYNNYTNVANTWINVINFSGYPAGLYQISIIKKTNASTYITAIVKWSATAGTVVSTIASNQLSITFSGTQLQAISGIATGTLMSANLQCLVTNEDFCS